MNWTAYRDDRPAWRVPLDPLGRAGRRSAVLGMVVWLVGVLGARDFPLSLHLDADGRTNLQEQQWGPHPAFTELSILLIHPEGMGYCTSERAAREPNARLQGLSTPALDRLAGECVNFTRMFRGRSTIPRRTRR